MDKQHQEWNEQEKAQRLSEWFWADLAVKALDATLWIVLTLIQAGGSAM